VSRRFRYAFILALAAFSTVLAALGGWRYARASAPVNGPIILISVDSLRADHLPVYGYGDVDTPAIDSLASDGVVFERAYAHVPQTLPAHATLLTGRLPFETGVRDGAGFTVKGPERQLSAMLRDRGYATGGVVSSYLLRRETGIGQGFAFFDADLPSGVGPAALLRDGTDSERIAENWLDSVATGRAFLFLHLAEPHRPYSPPERYSDYSPYDGEIAYADEIIGRLVRYLKAHQLYDRSTIILTADHGEGLGDHGETGHGLLLYDDVLRVPLVIKQPANEGAGRRVKDIVQQIDLVPTVLDLVKAPIPGHLHGRSLTPILGGREKWPARPVYGESYFGFAHFGWNGLVTITDGRYRLIEAPTPELYDLERDPDERENVADSQPEVVAALRNHLRELRPTPLTPQPDLQSFASQEREYLETLGYVGSLPSSSDTTADAPDPRDRLDVLERYRAAVELSARGDRDHAIDRFRALLRLDPSLVDVWLHLGRTASRADRHDVAADAYRHALHLQPNLPVAGLGASSALIRLRKLDEARRYAQQVVANATADDNASLALAHELLARIALIRREVVVARSEAELAEAAEPRRPVRAYVDGWLAFDDHRYEDALDFFEPALASLEQSGQGPLADLRLHAAEALKRLDRAPEAENLLMEELKEVPWNARARASLAALYTLSGREREAAALGK
jgi:arylsulfatase A-like enzyme